MDEKMKVFGLAMVLCVLVFAGCEDQQEDFVVPLEKEYDKEDIRVVLKITRDQ